MTSEHDGERSNDLPEKTGVFEAEKDQKNDISASKEDELVTKSPGSETSNGSKRYQTLRKRKQSGMIRLTKARNHLGDLILAYDYVTGNRSSKTNILRAIKKVKSEYTIKLSK